MKPIAIFQHTIVGSPGSIPLILEKLGIPYTIIHINENAPIPDQATDFSGLIFMGGYMSVYDDYPWIAKEITLIQQADKNRIPVIGHCLGSQLVSTAFGGKVYTNKTQEIGWNHIIVENNEAAEYWFGQHAGKELLTFQWHGDTFSIPPNATRIATSAYCENQAFVFNDIHIAIQSHLEMTPELVQFSYERNGHQLEQEYQKGNPATNSPEELITDLDKKTANIHNTLLQIYTNWTKNCAK